MNSQEEQITQLKQILLVLHQAERLKQEVRHSWLSNGRQESVAEHSWRVALMTIFFAPYLDASVNLEKCLKMAVLHDLAEAETGDIPVFEAQGQDRQQAKFRNEQQVIVQMSKTLGYPLGRELYDLWEEYERQESSEARFVRALDKVEVQLQHNEADLSTWLPNEKLMVFQPNWMKAYCEFDTTLSLLSDLIQEEAVEKLHEASHAIERLQEEASS